MKKNKDLDIFKKIDWITVLLYLGLVLAGWMNIFAAVYNEEAGTITDLSQKYGKQMLWIITAFVLGISIILLDTKIFFSFSYGYYLFIILLLLLVYLIAPEVKGARAWLDIGSFRLQAGEFAKFATALAISRYMSSYGFKITRFKDAFRVGFILILPMFIIIMQNDTGSALVFASFLLVFYREGMPGWILALTVYVVLLFSFSIIYNFLFVASLIAIIGFLVFLYINKQEKIRPMISLFIALLFIIPGLLYYFLDIDIPQYAPFALGFGVLFVPAVIYIYKRKSRILFFVFFISLTSVAFSYSVKYVFENILGEHQRSRLYVFYGMKSDPLGLEFNLNQSLIAIGSGDVVGKGFLNGTQTKNNFVPEQSTDFIFCTIGEEWGFVGSLIIIGAFIALLLRILHLAEKQRSTFSRIYGYSVVSILFFHFMVNIGMTIGLMPVIGIPLPFFSYGGSSLWAFTILLFIFIKLDSDKEILIQ